MTSTPPSLKDRKKMRLAVLEAEIFSARMQVKAEKLYLYALISGCLFGTVLYLFLLYLSLRMVPPSLFLNAPEFCVIFGVTLLVPAFAAGYVVFAGVLYLPKVLCKLRGTRIDLSLFHAVTYLYALHQSEPNLYAVVESLAKYAASYGEAAREFRQVISDCRNCSLDFYSALGRLSQTTPSEKFRSFLTGLSSSYRTLGSATEYLRMKTDELREEQRLSQKMYLNTLGVIAEIYITVFVAGPLFLVTVVMVMGVISSVNPLVLALIIYVMLPFGTALFLLILSVISDTHEETTTEIMHAEQSEEIRKQVFSSVRITIPQVSEAPAFEKLARRDVREKYLRFFHAPVSYMKFHPPAVFACSVPAALLLMAVLYLLFVPVPLTPDGFLSWIAAAENVVIAGVLIALVPFAVFYEIQTRYRRRVEGAVPDFVDQLVSAVRHNLTLSQAIDLIVLEGRSDMLEEIRMVRRDILWGSRTSDAVRRFRENVPVGVIDRMSVLLMQAEHFTDNLTQVLQIIAEDSKSLVMRKNERRGEMQLYVIVVYLAFFVFVFVQSIMAVMFLPMLLQSGSGLLVIGSGVTNTVTGWSPADIYNCLIYHSVLIHGFCSGLVAGMMGEGSVCAGIKHSCVMIAVAVVVFTFVKFFLLT